MSEAATMTEKKDVRVMQKKTYIVRKTSMRRLVVNLDIFLTNKLPMEYKEIFFLDFFFLLFLFSVFAIHYAFQR